MIRFSLLKKLATLQIAGITMLAIVVLLSVFLPTSACAQEAEPFTGGLTLPKVDFAFEKPANDIYQPLQLIMFLTILTIAPFVIVCTTSFVRITVIISFLKTSIGSTHAPSTQVWMGIAMTMTIFIMAPVWMKMEKEAITPYKTGKIKYTEFNKKMQRPLLEFMKTNTRTKDLKLFIHLSKTKKKEEFLKNPPWHIIIPAFIISELRAGFFVGFIIYLPFLCVDMITAAVLMSMGMFMLSPMSISMPLKVLTFCVIDGFDLIVEGLVKSYKY